MYMNIVWKGTIGKIITVSLPFFFILKVDKMIHSTLIYKYRYIKLLEMISFTDKQYQELFGEKPDNDDLERTNCKKIGEVGHFQCGVCPDHNKPRFKCGCIIRNK